MLVDGNEKAGILLVELATAFVMSARHVEAFLLVREPATDMYF
ncbi:MAG: hypothetical protein ACLR67_00205 [Eggerthella lenta]